jgi:hypothetical protein
MSLACDFHQRELLARNRFLDPLGGAAALAGERHLPLVGDHGPRLGEHLASRGLHVDLQEFAVLQDESVGDFHLFAFLEECLECDCALHRHEILLDALAPTNASDESYVPGNLPTVNVTVSVTKA